MLRIAVVVIAIGDVPCKRWLCESDKFFQLQSQDTFAVPVIPMTPDGDLIALGQNIRFFGGRGAQV